VSLKTFAGKSHAQITLDHAHQVQLDKSQIRGPSGA